MSKSSKTTTAVAAPKKAAKRTETKRPLRSVADRRVRARDVLALKELPNNSARVLKLAVRANGATGYELTAINGYEFPARKYGLDRVAKQFGFKVKVLGDASDGSPRYKFV